MRKFLCLLVAGFLATAAARADGKPEDVINEAIKAAGGKEKLDKYKGGSMKMEGELSVMGLDLKFDGTLTYMTPDKFKMSINTNVMGQKLAIEQVMNGKKMKSTLNGMELPLDDNTKTQLHESIAEQEISRLTPLLDAKKYTIKSGDDADVDGKKAAVIIVNSADGKVKDIKLFFDKKTNLLTKMQKKTTDESGKEVDEESFFEDNKAVEGLQTAHKVIVKRDGKEYMKFTISDVKYMEKVDDKEFPVDD